MPNRSLLVVLVSALVLPITAFAQTPEERTAARALVERRGPAVVMVLATVKTRMAAGSRETMRDIPVQTNATVLDASGLTVMALSSIEPGALLQGGRRGGEVSTETADLRIRTADDRELPARIVLRDADLDLLFIRPVDAPPAPLTAADGPAGTPVLMDLLVALQRTSENSGWRTFASFAYVQMVVDRPQPFYVLSSAGLGGALGFPVFDLSARFVGIMARVGGPRASPLPAIVPAQDIREIAKQATGR